MNKNEIVPTVASCAAGRAIKELSPEDLDLFVNKYDSSKGTNQAKWLTLNTSQLVRERGIQRHKANSCACEYEVV